jgi:hypothetical protein
VSRGGWLRKIEALEGAHRRRWATTQFGRNPMRSRASWSPTVDRGIEGEVVREEVRCTGADEKKGRKEGRVAADAFMAARWRDGEERGQGGPGSAPRGGWE